MSSELGCRFDGLLQMAGISLGISALIGGMVKLTYEDFLDILAANEITPSEEVAQKIYDAIQLTEKPESAATKQFIVAYCDAFKERWKTSPLITGKLSGIAKRLVKDLGKDKAIALVQTYLKMDDYTFTIRRHDLATFEYNLQSVQVMYETGQGVSQQQAKRKEAGNANAQAVKRYLERRES